MRWLKIRFNNYGGNQFNKVTNTTNITYFRSSSPGSDSENPILLIMVLLFIGVVLAYWYRLVMHYFRIIFNAYYVIPIVFLVSIVLYLYQAKKIHSWLKPLLAFPIQYVLTWLFLQTLNITIPTNDLNFWSNLRIGSIITNAINNTASFTSQLPLFIFPAVHIILIVLAVFIWVQFIYLVTKKLQNGNIGTIIFIIVQCLFLIFTPIVLTH